MKRLLFISLIILSLVFLSGCKPSRLVVRQRPFEPHYVQPVAPGPNYIWHNGEWIRHGNAYVYHKGFWMKAPPNHRNYIAGHWQRRRTGWIWIGGHWY